MSTVKGITIEIGANMEPLGRGLKDIQKESKAAQTELSAINRALKFDPKNTELLKQKQELLNKALLDSKINLNTLKTAKAKADAEMEKGTAVNQTEYRKLQREISFAEDKVKSLEKQHKEFGSVAVQQIKNVGNDFENAGKKVSAVGDKLSKVSAGVAGVGAATIKAYDDVDKGYDEIISRTGATGTAAKNLESVYNDVSQSVVGDFKDMGGAIGEINTRFNFTGDVLKNASVDFLEFARVNKTDVVTSVQKVARYMGDANIPAKEYKNVLDQLTKAAQVSGIAIDTLTEDCTKYGAPMRALGYDTKESIAIFSSWEKAGVNTEIAFSGMKKAIGTWGKQGKDARQEFKKTLDEIKACPDIASATSKAIEVFGQKAGPDLADAIKGGRFEYSKMLDAIQSSDGALKNTFNEISDGKDDAKLALQKVKVVAADVGKTLVTKLAPAAEKVGDTVKKLITRFTDMSDSQKTSILKFGALVIAIGPVLSIVGRLISSIKLVSTALSFLAANPIVAVISALGLLGFAYKKHIDKANEDTEAVKKLKKAHQDVVGPINDSTKAYNDLKKSQEESIKSNLVEVEKDKILWGELKTLVDANGRVTDANKDRAKVITGELGTAMGKEIDWVGNQITGYKDLSQQIDDYLTKKQAQVILDGHNESYAKATTGMYDVAINDAKLKQHYAELLKKKNIIDSNARAESEELFKNIYNDRFNGNIPESEIAKMNKDIEDYAQRKAESVSEYKEIVKQLKDTTKKQGENDKLLNDYQNEISTYEGLQQAMASGNSKEIQQRISTYNYDLKNNLKKSNDDLKKHVVDTGLAFTYLVNEYKKGGSNIKQSTIDSARETYKAAIAEYRNAGGAIPEGLTLGIDDKSGELYSATSDLENQLTSWSQSIGSGLISNISYSMDTAVNVAKNGANKILGEISKCVDVGANVGINIANSFRVPHYAEGAVLPPNRPHLAVVGDQTSGTNVETPLSTMVQAFRTAMSDIPSSAPEVNLILDGVKVSRQMYKYNKNEQQRHSSNFTIK